MNRPRRHLGYSLGGGRYQTVLDPNLFGMDEHQRTTIKIADNGKLADVC